MWLSELALDALLPTYAIYLFIKKSLFMLLISKLKFLKSVYVVLCIIFFEVGLFVTKVVHKSQGHLFEIR